MGEEAVVNEKNLFLVGDEVHRFYKDGEIQCALEDYNQIARYETKAEVMDYVKELQNNQQRAPQVTTIDFANNHQEFTEINGKYKTKVSFDVGQMTTVFGSTKRHMDVRINNYHKTWGGCWLGIACKTSLNLEVETSCTANKQYTFNINRNNVHILYSHRRYTHAVKNSGRYVIVTSYNLNVTNQHGTNMKRPL